MIPIAPTVFWGPMALAIMGGLLVGTILTLVFLPTLYVTWFETGARLRKQASPPIQNLDLHDDGDAASGRERRVRDPAPV
jgi:hypothetical protein